MSESFLRLASPPTVPRTAPTTGRPRRTSFNDAQESRTKPPVPEYDLPTIPPLSSSFALPPPVASPPISLASDDAMVDATEFSPPPVAPIARPAPLRRALSDYATPHAAPPSQLQRTHSITTELASVPDPPVDKTPKQVHQDPPKPSEHPAPIPDGAVQIVDEGDVLPTGDYQMDITFDDEGLNALERVFLLSQSDFGFHRAYVARVVGDLLEDVDPCESVEYVLPLLSGYSMDEDDLVQEAFSSQLHKILWYFFSTCRLVNEPSEIVSITSEGMSSVTKPEQDMPAIPLAIDPSRRASLATSGGASSAGSSLTMPPPSIFDGTEQDTPNSVNSVGTEQTAFSPQPFVDVNGGGDSAKEPLELVPQPELVINTFTPLLGNMLLSANPTVSENTRDAVIAVIGRLRGVVDAEKWVRVKGDQDERKSYISQGGMHAHDLRPFTADAKAMVESELLSGIVIGMGHLSTKPEDGDEPAASPEEIEAYRVLLEQEAEAGRTISMFFIGSLCETYSGSEVVERGFVEEVLRATHGDTNTRTEAAVALSRLAKIVPIDHARRMVCPTFVSALTVASRV
jgi:serine/threonine-protein phosphatase 4 regulatory subunit 1